MAFGMLLRLVLIDLIIISSSPIYVQGRESGVDFFSEKIINIGLHLDIYKPISFKLLWW